MESDTIPSTVREAFAYYTADWNHGRDYLQRFGCTAGCDMSLHTWGPFYKLMFVPKGKGAVPMKTAIEVCDLESMDARVNAAAFCNAGCDTETGGFFMLFRRP